MGGVSTTCFSWLDSEGLKPPVESMCNATFHMAIGKEITNLTTDVLVIGGGIGGAFAALKAREGGSNVLVVDKGRMGRTGCSVFTAGIMNAIIPGEDDMDISFWDTMEKSHYMVDPRRIKQHILDIYPLILEMDRYGVLFERDSQRKFVRAGKGGPLKFRSVDIMEAMRKTVIAKGIKLLSRLCITGLIVENERVQGAAGFDLEKGDFYAIWARAVILASGGCRYKGLAPGHRNCTGDGIAMAYRSGAIMCVEEYDNLSSIFISSCETGPGMNVFVRYGAKFYNRRNEDLIEKYSYLLPNKVDINILFPIFVLEVKLGNSPINMSLNHLTTHQVEDIRNTLPLATRTFERAGILQGDKFVKEMECQVTSPKGSMGIMIDADFMASLKGLYACGESLAMPYMGNNLAHASTSGAAAGRAAASYITDMAPPQPDRKKLAYLEEITYAPLNRKEGIEPEQVILSVQEAIMPYDVLLLKEGNRMQKALDKINDIRENQLPYLSAYDPHYLMVAHEANSMALQAEMQLRSDLMREESRFTLREDFPYLDNENWLKWVLVRKDTKGTVFFTRDVPLEGLQVERKKYLNPVWQALKNRGLVKLERERIEWV